MALAGQVLTLLGTQVTALGNVYRRETQSIAFRFTAAVAFSPNTLIAMGLAVLRGTLGELLRHLRMDTEDSTGCVTYLKFV